MDIENVVKNAARMHGVPGASVAVLKGQTIVSEVATGFINRDTRVRTTTDTVFQIGSITKTFTATMIMQLRDEGRLDLDELVVKYLPDFGIEPIVYCPDNPNYPITDASLKKNKLCNSHLEFLKTVPI